MQSQAPWGQADGVEEGVRCVGHQPHCVVGRPQDQCGEAQWGGHPQHSRHHRTWCWRVCLSGELGQAYFMHNPNKDLSFQISIPNDILSVQHTLDVLGMRTMNNENIPCLHNQNRNGGWVSAFIFHSSLIEVSGLLSFEGCRSWSLWINPDKLESRFQASLQGKGLLNPFQMLKSQIFRGKPTFEINQHMQLSSLKPVILEKKRSMKIQKVLAGLLWIRKSILNYVFSESLILSRKLLATRIQSDSGVERVREWKEREFVWL